MARNIEMALNFHKYNDTQRQSNNPTFSDNAVPVNSSQCHCVNIWNIRVNNHDIFLCGDFNARTSNLPDFITDEYTVFNGGQPNFVCSDILADSQRYNIDTKANTYGELLLELCKNTGLIIANGRLYQDKHRGSFTFFNRNRSSVIDYMLLEPNYLSMIKNFAIIPKLVECDHCPIEFSLKVQPFCNRDKSIKAYDHVAEYRAYHKYIWNVLRIDQYKLSPRNDECIKIIDHLTLNATSDLSSDHICELIQNLINNAFLCIPKIHQQQLREAIANQCLV